jgi:hypothetical protein
VVSKVINKRLLLGNGGVGGKIIGKKITQSNPIKRIARIIADVPMTYFFVFIDSSNYTLSRSSSLPAPEFCAALIIS